MRGRGHARHRAQQVQQAQLAGADPVERDLATGVAALEDAQRALADQAHARRVVALADEVAARLHAHHLAGVAHALLEVGAGLAVELELGKDLLSGHG